MILLTAGWSLCVASVQHSGGAAWSSLSLSTLAGAPGGGGAGGYGASAGYGFGV